MLPLYLKTKRIAYLFFKRPTMETEENGAEGTETDARFLQKYLDLQIIFSMRKTIYTKKTRLLFKVT